DELYYLLRALRNTFLTTRRTASRRPVTVATLEDAVVASPSNVGQPESALEAQEVYAAIAALPEDFRLAIVAVDVLGLSYREAARALHAREATITTRLFRARKQIAKRVLDESPPPAEPASADGRAGAAAADERTAPKWRVAAAPAAGAAQLGALDSRMREDPRPSGVLDDGGTS